MTLSDADRAAIQSEHLLSQTYDPGNPAAHPDGYIRYCRACWPRKCYAKLLDAALSDAQADLEREQAAHRESLRLAAERNGWTRDERDAARADAERLAEALKQAIGVSAGCCACLQIYEECDNDHVAGLAKWSAALALHRERRPAEEGGSVSSTPDAVARMGL